MLGDDSVYVFEKDVDVASVSLRLKELGLESGVDKQFVSTDACHYLQRWHSLRYLKDGVAHGARALFVH